MSSEFQGDVLLYDTPDGGNIDLTDDNLVVNDTGFNTAIYLCLEGGNKLDNGTEATKKHQYWGNLLEDDPQYMLTSRMQYIIEGYPATPNNLNRVKEAAKQDLKIFLDLKIVDNLEITATMPNRNRLNLEIEGYKDKKLLFNSKYEKNWLSKIG
jgi:phage gp46-like protein